jgi:large subunit ribosomal protein L24
MRDKIHLRKNDQVKVLAGKDRGKIAKVLRIVPAKKRAIVEGINFKKKHTRANPAKGIQAGITQQEAPISLSTLMIVCSECGKQTRVKHRVLDDGSKQRICAKCGGTLDK